MPTLRQVLALAVPQMGLMLCHLGIAMTDLWVAGRLDTTVLAALGVVSQVFSLLVLITSIVGSGCLAAVSQALGAGMVLRARRYAGLIVLLACGAGAVVGAAGFLALSLLLAALSVPESLQPVVRTFVGVYCLNLPLYYTLLLLNSVFRAYTLVRLPLVSFSLVFVCNLIGSLGLGLGSFGFPNWGYAGIAWATFAATLPGLACSLVAARRHGILVRESFAPWRWNRRAMPYLFRVGAPTALGQLVEHGARLMMVPLVATLPGAVDIMAGMTLGMRIQSLALFPLGGISLTMAIFSGHLLGAGAGATLYAFGKKTALWSTAAFAVLALALFFVREPVAAFMAPRPEAVRHAVWYLAFSCIGIPVTTCTMSLYGLFAGAGATLYTFLMSCLSMWGVQVPLAWLLGHVLGWGETGIYTGIVGAEIAYLIAIVLVFRSRKWLACGQSRKRRKSCEPDRA